MLPTLGSVLIVEDGMLLSLDLEDTFEDWGVRDIRAATSLAGARSKLEQFNPALVTLDIDLGDGSSADLVPMLRDRAIPYVVISGRPPQDLPEAFEDAAYVPKPFDRERLRAAIAAAAA